MPGNISSRNDKQPTVQVGTNGLHIGKFTTDLWRIIKQNHSPCDVFSPVSGRLRWALPLIEEKSAPLCKIVHLKSVTTKYTSACSVLKQCQHMPARTNALHFVFDLLRPVGTGPPADLGHIPLEQSCNREKRRCDPEKNHWQYLHRKTPAILTMLQCEAINCTFSEKPLPFTLRTQSRPLVQ